jgi:ketosteroid isomerase-like protein
MNRFHIVASGLLLLTSLAGAAQTRPEGHRVVTKTRLQVIFSDLENQWLTAIQKKDARALGTLLSDNFQVWTPTQAEPIPLEDWRQQAFSSHLQSFQLRQLAVRAVSEDVSVASFVLSQTVKANGKVKHEEEFVVDVWVRGAEGWRCTDRYTSTLAATNALSHDLRPTGKQ